MEKPQEKLLSDYPVVAKAPTNFFLGGEHSVMFGELAICQAIPLYVYVGLKRILGDRIIVKPAVYPDPETMEYQAPEELPTRDKCVIEKLLWDNNYKGVEIYIVSSAPRGCGLATSGSLGAALSLALHYMFSNKEERKVFLTLQEELANEARSLKNVQSLKGFKSVWQLAWKIDALFHNHSSSGANAFFSVVGSPNGLPATYRGALRRGDYEPQEERKDKSTFPLKAYNEQYGLCKYQETEKCLEGRPKCPDFSVQYRLYEELPFDAAELKEWNSGFCRDLFRYAVGVCYCGIPKRTGEVIRKVAARSKSLRNMMNSAIPKRIYADRWETLVRGLGVTCEELVFLILSPCNGMMKLNESQEQVFTAIRSIQSKLKYDIEVSYQTIDAICEAAEKGGLAAKLTGAGIGGDVVIFGRTKEQLRDFMSRLRIQREGKKWKPTIHVPASCWAEGTLWTSPVSLVKKDLKNVLLRFDISGETPTNIREKAVNCLQSHKKDLLAKNDGQCVLSAGDAFVASFSCVEDAIDMVRLIYRRCFESTPQALLRAAVYTGTKDFTTSVDGEHEISEISHVTHLEEDCEEGHVLICSCTYKMLPKEYQESFKKIDHTIDNIVCYITRENWMK